MLISDFLLGISIGIAASPIWYILVEIADKFYQAFIANREE